MKKRSGPISSTFRGIRDVICDMNQEAGLYFAGGTITVEEEIRRDFEMVN